MKRPHVLWQFVRDDAVARSLGLAIMLVAWFAATWLSLGVASLLIWLRGLPVRALRNPGPGDVVLIAVSPSGPSAAPIT